MRTLNAMVAMIVAALFMAGSAAADNKYVGAKFCGMCHKMKDKGEAFAVPECLKCHVTGGGAATNVEATFKKEEGVTCEACHGPASAYKMVHNKGDLAKSKEAGLILPDKTDAKFCEKCHNSESPTFKGFKITEMWAKIEHHGPPKK